jgi:Fe-Mn family superoxide dismutase
VSVPSSHVAPPPEAARQTYPFVLADLPFAYDALEPHLDQKTLQIHHRGHHAAYVKKLNEVMAKQADLQKLTLTQLLREIDRVPADIRPAVKNNGGGHLNHDLFWNSLAPEPARAPPDSLAESLTGQFGSLEEFRKKFSAVASAHFASGWVALTFEPSARSFEIIDLKDHEVVAHDRAVLLMLDVWEHAYYLKYQNRRAEFIEAFWKVANWAPAAEVYERMGGR